MKARALIEVKDPKTGEKLRFLKSQEKEVRKSWQEAKTTKQEMTKEIKDQAINKIKEVAKK